MELTDDGKASVALGLLRDGQNEMALDYWDTMRSTGTQIPEWVSATFVYVLVLRGFMDEAVQLFRQVLEMAKNNSNSVPLSLWSYILDECSRALHYKGTKLVWDEMVSPGKINPADGIALNVLNTAARHGDTALATAVIELLSAREVKLGFHHYEPLLESYVHAGNLEVAFRVLGIMNDAGIQPDQPSTRAIFSALKDSPDLTEDAIRIIHNLGRVPVAAVNVVLEAVATTTAAAGDMAKTLDVYRQVCDLCQSGPNQQTFALLLSQCRRAEPAVYLVAEMDRFSVRPSPPILDSLIRCFARDGNLGVALAYLDEMSRFAAAADAAAAAAAAAAATAAPAAGGPVSPSASVSAPSSSLSSSASVSNWVSERTLLTVLRRCYREKDERAFALVAEARKRGMAVDMDTVRKLEQASSGKFEDEDDG
jgi:pentatricopeptide repeat protein